MISKPTKDKNFFYSVILCTAVVISSGCSLLGAALSAGAAYGIYQATR